MLLYFVNYLLDAFFVSLSGGNKELIAAKARC